MMHPIKRFIFIAAVACMVPAVAFASTARMTGLGISGDYVKDYTGMFTYLSTVNSVGNLVYAEAGSMNDDRGMGVVLPNLFDGRAGVWALHLRHYTPALGQSWWGAPINGGNWSDDPNDDTDVSESFDLMWGHKMGSMNLGLRLNRQFESYNDGTGEIEGAGSDGRNVLGFGAGVGFDMNENTALELGAQYQSRTFDNGTDKEDGGAAYLLSGRAWMKMGASTTLVPVVKLWSVDHSETDGTTTTDDKYSGWQAGVAGNWNVGRDDLLVLGANLIGNKQDTGATEYTETLLPNVFMALETHLNPWLTFRCGAQTSVMATEKVESPSGTTKYKYSDFSFMMGTTVKMGNVQFDAVLDPYFFNNPFAQLQGNSGAEYGWWSDAVFPQVSLTYTW